MTRERCRVVSRTYRDIYFFILSLRCIFNEVYFHRTRYNRRYPVILNIISQCLSTHIPFTSLSTDVFLFSIPFPRSFSLHFHLVFNPISFPVFLQSLLVFLKVFPRNMLSFPLPPYPPGATHAAAEGGWCSTTDFTCRGARAFTWLPWPSHWPPPGESIHHTSRHHVCLAVTRCVWPSPWPPPCVFGRRQVSHHYLLLLPANFSKTIIFK